MTNERTSDIIYTRYLTNCGFQPIFKKERNLFMNNQEVNNQKQNQEFCNQCNRQCPKDDLLCGRGRAYFGIGDNGDERGSESGDSRSGDHRDFNGDPERKRGYRAARERLRKERMAELHRDSEGRHHGHGGWHGQSEEEMPLSQLLSSCGHIAGHADRRFRGQGRILHILSQQQEMSQKELQEAMQVEAGSLSEIMGKMEAKGILERKKDDNDRRRMLVQLTEAGRKAALESMKDTNTGKDMFQVLSEEEQQQLKEILVKLLKQWKEDFAKEGHGRQNGHRHGGDHQHSRSGKE